jgi:hypothetical protein
MLDTKTDWPTDRDFGFDFESVVRSEKLVAEAEDSSGTQRKGERPLLEAATKQQLVKTEKTLCVL